MSTHFETNFDDSGDDIIHAEHVTQYAEPIQNLESGAALYREDIGTGDAYKVNFFDHPGSDNVVTDYSPGLVVYFKAETANTGAATLSIKGSDGEEDPEAVDLDPIPLVKNDAQPLDDGDINAGQVVAVVYTDDVEHGPRFQVLGLGAASAGGGGASELSDLDDVEVTGPADGQVLQYDDSIDKFVNRSPADAGLVEEARTISTTAPLSGGGDLSANRTISMAQASASQDGYLDSADFTAFAAKQDALTAPDDVPGLTAALADKQDQSGALDDITSLAAGMDKGIFVYDGTSVIKLEPSSSNGDVLSADDTESSGFAWVTPSGGGGGASELSDLNDVEVTGPADGQVLQYNDSIAKFVNRSPADAGLVEEARTISTTAPLSGGGDLSANRTISMAQASASQDGYLDSADFAAFAAKQDQSEALDDISTLAAGMDKGIFVYDGTSVIKLEPSSSNGDVLSADDTESSGFAWVTPSGGGGGASELSDLDDVEVTGPADGQVLQYDDSVDKFVNRSPSDAGLVEEARTISTSAPLSGGGDLSANRTISMAQASASQDGYLDSADFIAFAAKQDALTEPDDVPGLTVALDDKQDQSGALDDITSLAAGMDKGIFVYDGTSVVKFEPSANNGDVLSADNSEPSGFAWVAPGSGGGLTSPVGISDGGTGATTAAGARTNLDVPSNATLTSGLAGKAASTHTHAATEIGSGTVSNTEFGYLDGVTSNIQSQLDGKAISGHTHAASSITSGTFAVARIPTGISAANISGGTVSNTEFDYLNGVTSAIQTQLNGKTSGSGSSNRLAFWSSTSGLTSDASIYRSGAAIYAGGYYSDSGAFASETTTLYLMSNLTERARFQSGQTFIAGVRNLAAGQLMYWNTSNGEVLYQFSRGAHKEDVKKVDLTIDELMRWRPVEFKWKEKFGGVPDVGLIAEEVAEVYPLAATYDQPWEYLDEKTGEYAVNEDGSPKKLEGDPIVAGVKYEKAWIPMLAAVQDFYGKFKEEQAKTAKLEARLAALEGAKS